MSLSFRNTLSPNNERKIYMNIMSWFGLEGHVSGYRSDSPWVIRQQLEMYNDAGCDGVIVTCGGLTKPIQIAMARIMCEQCEVKKMEFVLLLDHSIVGKSVDGIGVAAQLNDPLFQDMFNSPAYIPEKYVFDFDFTQTFKDNGAIQASADAALVKLYASFPKLSFQRRHVGFSWPEWKNTIATLNNDNANPAMVFPGVMWDFNDMVLQADGKTIQSAWSTASEPMNARIVEPANGNLWFQCVDLIPPKAKKVHIVTGNDLQERTGRWEGILKALTGRRF